MSKPKAQELPQKPKTAGATSDLRSRSSSTQLHEKAVAEISMKDFLDFLKISYQVNEAIDNPALDITERGSVDWKKLTSDALISRLKECWSFKPRCLVLLTRTVILCVTRLTIQQQRSVVLSLEEDLAAMGLKPEYPGTNEREALINKQKIEKLSSKPPGNPDNTTASGTVINATQQNAEERPPERASSVEKVTENTSCESLYSSVASVDRKSEKPNFGRKKSQGLKKESSNESETSRSFESNDDRTPSRQLKKKLNEVLQEGILDSVLPYLLPKPPTQENAQAAIRKPFPYDLKKPAGGNLEKSEKPVGCKEKAEFRKKYLGTNDLPDKNDRDTEVVIHVCDEIKNLKKDFRCSQKLLLSQMGYFAEVTAGQKLEDMDISVHCDVTIFDWLMQWIQKDSLIKELWPILDPTIAIPILMSSTFLQINSLHDYCLQFCKTHINDIIRDSPNLNCLNDNVLTRLANLFSNIEVENIVDKKDRIQSKLFCKLILALTEPEPQSSRGHYSSLATIYRCSKCLKLILKNKSNSMLCMASNMKMDRYGTIHSTHVYDSSWNLTDYIRDLRTTLKSWRRVYWRLWADCHLLYCQVCEEYFPIGRMSWCLFHVDSVQYFPLENSRSAINSIGRYPCCGERVYRFEVIKNNSGCQYRDHIVNAKSNSEKEILKIWNYHKDVIKCEPPPFNDLGSNKLIKTTGEDGTLQKSPLRDGFWWEGLEIVPVKQPSGLLNRVWDAVIKKDDSKNAGSISENKNQKSPVTKSSVPPQSSIQDISSLSDSSDDSCSSSNAGNSEESYHASKGPSKSKSSNFGGTSWVSSRTEGNRFWLSKLSTRCNQDNQREFEERALRQIESVLAKKLSGEGFRTSGSRSSYQVVPLGGVYIKLEQEWREAHCFSHGCPGSSMKARGSASHVNINNSTFSVHKRSKSRGHR